MRKRVLLAGGAAGLLVVAVAVAALTQPPPVALPVNPSIATTAITRGPLSNMRKISGMLGYGLLTVLRPTLGTGSSIVAWIAPIGATVERGEPLYRLDGQPAILLYGSVPQYRTLRFDPRAMAPVWVELEQASAAVTASALALQLQHARLAVAKARANDLGARLADARLGTPATPEFAQLTGAVRMAEAKVARARAVGGTAVPEC